MKIIIKILFLLLFSKSAFSYCDLEIVNMGSDIKSLVEKTNFVKTNNTPSSQPDFFAIPVEEFCKDSKFIMFPINFTFINNKLHQIFIEDMLTNINHLDNLKYYYGNPTEEYEDSGTTGIKYYHWDLSFKQVFLVIKYSPTEIIQNIEIVSNRFTDLMEKYNEDLEE